MRKSIFCTVLLAVLASVLMAVPALATEYFRVLTITPNKTSYTFDSYAATKNLASASIRFDISALYKSDDRLPSGYNNGNTITWTVTVNPSTMDAGTTDAAKVRIAGATPNTTTLTKANIEAGTVSASLVGTLKGSATITVTAVQSPKSTGGQGSAITKKLGTITITIPEKPDPTLNAATASADRLLAVTGAAATLTNVNGSFDKKTNGTIVVSADAITNLTFINYPESMSMKPSPSYLNTNYGITITDKVGSTTLTLPTNSTEGAVDLDTNKKAAALMTSATTQRVITFSSTAASIKKQISNYPITFNVWNRKADGTAGDKQEFTIYLTIRPSKYPAATVGSNAIFKTAEPVTDANKVTLPDKTKVKDLGTKAKTAGTDKKPVPAKNIDGDTHDLYGLQMVKTGATLATSGVTWTTEKITTPAVIYATGLPDGMYIEQDGTTATTATVESAVTGTLKGSPKKAGYYNNIKIIVSNDGGVYSDDYVMDVVSSSISINEDTLPDMTWGVKYEATVTATSADNPYHPTVFSIVPVNIGTKNKPEYLIKSPGLTIAKKTGVLKGKFESSDRALEAVKLSSDYALSGDAEKTIHLVVTISNDWTYQVSKDLTLTLKAVKPELKTTVVSTQNAFNKAGLMFGVQDDTSLLGAISVKGPGKMKFSFDNFPDGIQYDTASEDIENALVNVSFFATPTMTAKNQAATVTISNAAGSVKVPIKISIGAKATDFTLSMDNKVKQVKIGDSIDKVAIDASFGPVKWTAQNLPKGLRLSVDKSVSNDARVWIVGAPTTSTKIDKNGLSPFTVIATDTTVPSGNAKLEAKISQDLKIFPKPKIITNSLPALTLDKAYNAKITGSGGGANDQLWVVKIEEVPAPEQTSRPGTKKLPGVRKVLDSSDADLTTTFSVGGGQKHLIVSADKKTGMPIIMGSLDRMPESGRLKVSIKFSLGSGDARETVSADNIIIYVKGTPAKIGTARIQEFSRTDTTVSYDVIATGTASIDMNAFVKAADAKKLLNLSLDQDIDLAVADNVTGIKFSFDATGRGKLISAGGGKYAFKNLPVHIQASNVINYNSATGRVERMKSVDKTFKVTMPGVKPEWMRNKDSALTAAIPDITFFGEDGVEITDEVVYQVSGDLPYEVRVNGKVMGGSRLTETKNGLTATYEEPENNTPGKITIAGTPTAGKETKTLFTLLVTNTATKEKSQVKVNFIGEQRPTVTTKMDSEGYVADKVIEVGKALSYKLTAKGSRASYSKSGADRSEGLAATDIAYVAMSWDIGDATAVSDLVAIGLSFDSRTGAFKGTATGPTSNDSGEYEPLEFTITPRNSTSTPAAEKASAKVRIGVKGRKPRIMTKTISLYRDSSDQYNLEANQLATNLTNDESANVKWAWSGNAADTAGTWGFSDTITSSGNLGKLAPDENTLPTATKGITLKVSADNMGSSATANVKFIIKDADPTISGTDSIPMESAKDSAELTTEEYELGDADAQMTGDTKMLWKIAKNAGSSKVKATLKQYSDGTGCTVTVRADKKISPDLHTSFVLSVTNQSTKVTVLKVISVDVAQYTESTALPADKDSSEEAETAKDTLSADKALSGDELPAGEGTVTYGESRGESALTEAERTALSEGGYIIAAILPEITTDESGQYDLDAVSLDEAAPEGYELAWFAFPRRAESSDDDSIAEFYDEAGAEVFAVPEGRKVIPSPWLEKEVTYAPVIAVKAPSTADAKTSFDHAAEGDTVTVKAIEEAAQKTAEESADSEKKPEVISEEAKHEEASSEAPAEE